MAEGGGNPGRTDRPHHVVEYHRCVVESVIHIEILTPEESNSLECSACHLQRILVISLEWKVQWMVRRCILAASAHDPVVGPYCVQNQVPSRARQNQNIAAAKNDM